MSKKLTSEDIADIFERLRRLADSDSESSKTAALILTMCLMLVGVKE
jgi:hypothetical protein